MITVGSAYPAANRWTAMYGTHAVGYRQLLVVAAVGVIVVVAGTTIAPAASTG